MKIKKRLIFTALSPIACIPIFLTACFMTGEIPQDTNVEISQTDSNVIDTDPGSISSDENTAPVAIIEIYQQNSDGYYINAGNPAYFTAEDSFDPDGDELEYIWEKAGRSSRDR